MYNWSVLCGLIDLFAAQVWSSKPIGRLPSASVVGFAKLKGLGRCVLTADGSASYYKGGRILQRPTESYNRSSTCFGDIDGDGFDERVEVGDGQVIDSVWQSGKFVPLDRTPLPHDRRYESPVLVPNVDRGRAYLLLQVALNSEGNTPSVAVVAYQKVEDRWVKAWERPAVPVGRWSMWTLRGGSKVVAQSEGQEWSDQITSALLSVEKDGYRIVWQRHQKLVEGRTPIVCFCNPTGAWDNGYLAVETVYPYHEARSPRMGLFDGSQKSLIQIAPLPPNASAVWTPQSSIRLLIAGQQVYRLNIPNKPR